MTVAKTSKRSPANPKAGQRGLIFLMLIPLAGLIALLIPSPVVGHDSWLHLIWLEQFTALVHDGVLYPRWLNLSNGGFGSPTFYFYPPLAAYLATLWSFISFGATDIGLFRFVAFIGTIASIFSFRYYLKRINIESKLAWAGGMLYAMLPYRAVDLVLRNALGEHLAFVWIPLVFAGIELLRNGDRVRATKGFILSAVSFALLLLSNIPSAIAVGVALPIYVLVRHEKRARSMMRSVAALLAGALLSAFYLLPAITLRPLIQSSHLWDAGTSKTGAAFTLSDIFATPSNSLTNANLVMLLCGVLAFGFAIRVWRREKEQTAMLAWSAVIALAVLMQLPVIASFMYELPIFSYLQFSWRWNLLLVPAIASVMVLSYQRKRTTVLAVMAMLALTTIMVVTGFNSKYEHHQSTDILKVEYSDAFEYIPASALTGTQAIANFVAKHRTDPPVLLDGPGIAALASQEGEHREYNFELPRPATATFHLFHWPLWELSVNGKVIPSSADDFGRMTASIPAGKHRATINRTTDRSETTGWAITLGAALILIGSWTTLARRRGRADGPALPGVGTIDGTHSLNI